MRIGKKFNQLSFSQYKHYIDNHKKYKDFNTLGLYRSLLENENLSLEEKIEIRDYAHQFFFKTFEFFQVKDPELYIDLSHLGEGLLDHERKALWEEVRENRQKILKRKRIRHRNFGVYAKHACGHEDCSLNGVMLKKGKGFRMTFPSDKRGKRR